MPIVTKEQLARLRAGRLKNNARLDYTIGGPVQTRVVSSEIAEREQEILRGERTLKHRQNKIEHDYTFSSHSGLSKAHFNHSKGAQTMKEKSHKPHHQERSPKQQSPEHLARLDAYRDMQRDKALAYLENKDKEIFQNPKKEIKP